MSLSTVIVKKRRQKRVVVQGGLRGVQKQEQKTLIYYYPPTGFEKTTALPVTPTQSGPTEQFQSSKTRNQIYKKISSQQGLFLTRTFWKVLWEVISFIYHQKLVGRIPAVPTYSAGPTCLDYKVHSSIYRPWSYNTTCHTLLSTFFQSFHAQYGASFACDFDGTERALGTWG